MKKRTVGILVAVLCVVVAGASFATGWLVNNKSESNTVKIGSPVTISVTGSVANDTVLMPGGEIETIFTVELDGVSGYALMINNVSFMAADTTTDKIADIGVWSFDYKVGEEGSYTGTSTVLTGAGQNILATAVGGQLTLKLILAAEGNVDVALAGATLTFDVALVK